MSETLRPWLRQYTLEHAQNAGLNLDAVKPTVRICQLIHFRTYEVDEDPNGPPGGLWAEISDGQWHIPVHIPAHSVEAVVRATGAAMTKLTGGIFRVSPTAFVCQCLPTNRTAIERDARLALRVDVKDYVGSAGENTFKDPRPIMDDAPVRTWVRALRGDRDALQSFSSVVTEALLEEEQRRKANVGRKPSRNGSTVVAGLIPRERERERGAHRDHKNSNPLASRPAKPAKKEKARERSVREKALAEYRAAWGKRSLKMKWYLVPDEQCEVLKTIEFPTDEEAQAARANQATRPVPALPQRNRDALDLGNLSQSLGTAPTSPPALLPPSALPPSSAPAPSSASSPFRERELPSSLPTQTATSAPSPELGPPEALEDDDDGEDEEDVQIEWPSSPPVGRNDEQGGEDEEGAEDEDKFVFATPRPPATLQQPIILVPNSDPSSRATNSQSQSQSQSQSVAHGSQPLSQSAAQSQPAAQSSQQSQPVAQSQTHASSSQQQQKEPRSSAAPTHVSDTVLGHPTSAPDGDESLTQSTSQSQSQPQPQPQPQIQPQPAHEQKPQLVQEPKPKPAQEQKPQPQPAQEPKPRPAQEQKPKPKLEAVVDSVTESTESQSQPQPAPAEVAMDVAMDVDPAPELAGSATLAVPTSTPMDEDDAMMEAYLRASASARGDWEIKIDGGDGKTTATPTNRARVDGRTAPVDEDDDWTEFEEPFIWALNFNNHGGFPTTRKRAREDGGAPRVPAAKRARRNEPGDAASDDSYNRGIAGKGARAAGTPAAERKAEATAVLPAAKTTSTTGESSVAAAAAAGPKARSGRARKTVDNREKATKSVTRPQGDSNGSKEAVDARRVTKPVQPDNHASAKPAKRSRDAAGPSSSTSKRALEKPLPAVESADSRQTGVRPTAAEPPVKRESPSPVQRPKRSPETRLHVPDAFEDEGPPVQPPHMVMQDVMDVLFTSGKWHQRWADEHGRASR